MMPSHVSGGKRELKQPEAGGGDVGQVGKRCPRQRRAATGLGGHRLPKAAAAPGPAARVVGLAGVTCHSQARKSNR